MLNNRLRTLLIVLLGLVCKTGWSQTVIWEENWDGIENGTNVTKVNSMYKVSKASPTTFVIDDTYAGGEAPELILYDGVTWIVTIKDLKGCYGNLTLTLNSNTTPYFTINEGKIKYSKIAEYRYEATIPVEQGTTSLVIKFTAKGKNCRFDNLSLTSEMNGQNISLSQSDNDITLSNIANANVTLSRPMVKNDWNTFCVPFDISQEQIKKVFGKGTKVLQFANSTANSIKFANATSISPCVPYLVKPTSDMPEGGYVFNSVRIVDDKPVKKGTDGNVQFLGTYAPNDITKNLPSQTFAAGIVSGSVLKKAKAGTKMNGFRAFFIVPATTSASSVAVSLDGETTSISHINNDADAANAPIYNLQGQCVGTSTDGLPHGVYIRGGKKIVLR